MLKVHGHFDSRSDSISKTVKSFYDSANSEHFILEELQADHADTEACVTGSSTVKSKMRTAGGIERKNKAYGQLRRIRKCIFHKEDLPKVPGTTSRQHRLDLIRSGLQVDDVFHDCIEVW